MYTHSLKTLACEVLFDEAFNDNVYKHVVYLYLTSPNGEDGKPDFKNTKMQSGVVYLDAADAENFIPSAEVTREKIEEWVASKLDIPALQAANIAEFSE